MSKNIPLMILDGGLGTLLYSRGAFVKGDPLWSVRCLASPPESEARRQLYQAHLDYLMAGANIIKTNSYQMSPDHLRKCVAGLSQVTPQPHFFKTQPLLFRDIDTLSTCINEY